MLADKVESSDSSRRRKRAASSSTSATASEQLTLIQNVLDNTILDSTSAQSLIDQISSVSAAQMTLEDQSKSIRLTTYGNHYVVYNLNGTSVANTV